MTVEQEGRRTRMRLRGQELVDKVKELVHEGNVRRIIIKNETGHTVIEIPVTAGVVVTVAAPIVTAVGAIAALANDWHIEIDRGQAPDAGDDASPGQ